MVSAMTPSAEGCNRPSLAAAEGASRLRKLGDISAGAARRRMGRLTQLGMKGLQG